MKSTTHPVQTHSCCGSHADLSSSTTEISQGACQDGVLDVRMLAPARRHSLIFETFEGLRPGGFFVLVNDHDPKPLYYQFEYERTGTFTWNYEEQGPEVWRVRIGKTEKSAAPETAAPVGQ
jgi:uncharacterized protein (DUF2249 family)